MSSNKTLSARIRLIGACGIAVVALTACGSKAADTTAPTETTAVSSETSSASVDTTAATVETTAVANAADTAATAETSAAPAVEATAAASGAAAVQGVILTDGEATAERTISVIGRAFEPNTLTVKVGETVSFQAADKEISSVIVGDLPGATVTDGLIETFQFSIPGTYSVKEDVSGNTATIIVE